MLTTNEFQSTLYRSQRDMLAGIAYEYWTAGGANTPEMVSEMIPSVTPEQVADECIEEWGLDRADDFEDRPSHMEFNGYTRADLTRAMAEFMAERPDMAA